jgi:hypothetical protein
VKSLANYIKRLPTLTLLPKEELNKTMSENPLFESSDNLDMDIPEEAITLDKDISELNYNELTRHLINMVDMQLAKLGAKK